MSEKKANFSEDDIFELLQRYSASAIISLLQEISEYTSIHSDTEKIDWTELVKNTTTGISNAREYQMLWRHLAYRNSLLENVEDGAEPLDDDSDLEIELETVPAPSVETLAEAKECAEVLLASGPSRDSGSASPSTGPKQLLPTGSCIEDLDGNGSGNSPSKKKRQLWSKEEDMELIAAVQKCGEGNWANILKGDFKHNRSASQLSQRWAIIRKRQANSSTENSNKISSSTLSEERLAAQKAFSMAVNMPMPASISSKISGATQAASSSTSSTAISEASSASIPQPLIQSRDKGVSNPSSKPRTTPKTPANPQPSVGPNPSIQAAAFAAGGRIANPSTAAALFKAAQSKNALHIRPGGGSLRIPSAMVSKPLSTTTSGIQSGPRQVRPSSVHPLSKLIQPLSATFGTITMSALKAACPVSLPLTSCTTTLGSSTQQTSLESIQGATHGVGSQENVKSGNSSDNPAIGVGEDAAEMRSDDAATQKGLTGVVSSSASETQKEGQMEKKETDDEGLSGGDGDIEIPAKEGESAATEEEAVAANQNANEEPKTPVDGKVAD